MLRARGLVLLLGLAAAFAAHADYKRTYAEGLDAARAEDKYGTRAARFQLLEAGHLMQNLCLLSESVGLSTLPLGGFFEREIGRALPVSPGDVVLYVGALG